ncbi:MAG: carboxypeptidase regulatory-like domain-containing protein [Burkholderiaceae bacterium]
MPARPLNAKAAAAADTALYDAHRSDARPNALYDATGRKQPLSATDPAQQCLRDEWVEQYGKNGGKVESPKPADPKSPGSAVQPCPCKKAKLIVTVRYDPLAAPVANVKVTLTGPVTRTLATDAAGSAKFVDLPPGKYDVSARYDRPNALVDLAAGHVGDADWAVSKARAPFPEETNKCNLFVYEMATGAGYAVPQKPHVKLYGLGATVMLPPNAGSWASPTESIGTSMVVGSPEPGDIVAWSHPEYTDATGHVAIVSYPKPAAPRSKTLKPGEDGSLDMTLRRQVIGANQYTVDEDDHHFWHYYDEGNAKETGRIVFRRLSK